MGLPIITALFGIAIAFAVLDLLVPRDHHADLRSRDDGHDRTRRGYRLRPVHRHPLPAGPGRGARSAQGRRGLTGHVGAVGGLRRLHGDPLAPRPVHPAAAVHAGSGRRGHRRRGAGHAGRGHPAAGHARLLGSGHRQAARPRPAPERRRAVRRGASGTGGAGRSSAARSWPALGRAGLPASCWSSRSSPCGWPSPTPATTRPARPPARPSTRWPPDSDPGFNGPLVVAAPRARRAAGRRRDAPGEAGSDPRGGLRRAGPVLRVGPRRGDHRLSDHLAAVGDDRDARAHPA